MLSQSNGGGGGGGGGSDGSRGGGGGCDGGKGGRGAKFFRCGYAELLKNSNRPPRNFCESLPDRRCLRSVMKARHIIECISRVRIGG